MDDGMQNNAKNRLLASSFFSEMTHTQKSTAHNFAITTPRAASSRSFYVITYHFNYVVRMADAKASPSLRATAPLRAALKSRTGAPRELLSARNALLAGAAAVLCVLLGTTAYDIASRLLATRVARIGRLALRDAPPLRRAAASPQSAADPPLPAAADGAIEVRLEGLDLE
jgi:hypothetical protein